MFLEFQGPCRIPVRADLTKVDEILRFEKMTPLLHLPVHYHSIIPYGFNGFKGQMCQLFTRSLEPRTDFSFPLARLPVGKET